MAFTKQHYERIAAILRTEVLGKVTDHEYEGIVDEFVAMFREDNSRFVPERFRKACHGKR